MTIHLWRPATLSKGVISIVGVLARARGRAIEWRTGIAFRSPPESTTCNSTGASSSRSPPSRSSGHLAGKHVADRLSPAALNRGFAVLLVAVGAFVGIDSLVSLAAS